MVKNLTPNDFDGLKMEEITVYGMTDKPSAVSEGNMSYDEGTKVLKIKDLTLAMAGGWTVTITM